MSQRSSAAARRLILGPTALWFVVAPLLGQAETVVDLADLSPDHPSAFWVYGSEGIGNLGLPVAAGDDVDGDGLPDLAVAFIRASPFGRTGAGEVDLVFGDGTLDGFLDTSVDSPRILRIAGDDEAEVAGGEIWIDDVTGDGLADLLICRQNHTPAPGRIGAGALTILPGGPHLRALAAAGTWIDLRDPPSDLPFTTIVGRAALDRLGLWARSGDLDGDGIGDVVLGADQEDLGAETNRGAAWILRGGPHLADAGIVDLTDFGSTALQGQIARITPPAGATNYHFGATAVIADLDGNGRGEVLVAATVNRGGAIIPAAGAPPDSAQGSGGAHNGHVFIAWDDNFPVGAWPTGFELSIDSAPGTTSRLRGEIANISFGEEILAGLDFDGDGKSDLFVGDLAGDGSPGHDQDFSGLGHVIFDTTTLPGVDLDLQSPPADRRITRILGGATGALGADSGAQGDFDADGAPDLAITSPHANPLGRDSAGAIHVLFGGQAWPETIDLGALPPAAEVRIAAVYGAHATDGDDHGDTLGYSAAAADLDLDGRLDLVANEMVGNGIAPGTVDVGNLVVVGGDLLAPACVRDANTACLLDGRFRVEGEMLNFLNPPDEFPVRVMELDGRAETDFAVFLESFAPGNFEVGVKMVDGCGLAVPPPQRGHWLFLGGLTNAETIVSVVDSARPGEAFNWVIPAGELPQTLGLTPAFPCEEIQPPNCERSEFAACLQDRFQVTGQMRDFADPPASFATRVMEFDGRAESDQAVFFESFNEGNFEVGVKMVDACGLPEGHPQRGYWTFYGGLTNAFTDIRVTDTRSGQTDLWHVPPGSFPRSEARTPAFPCDSP